MTVWDLPVVSTGEFGPVIVWDELDETDPFVGFYDDEDDEEGFAICYPIGWGGIYRVVPTDALRACPISIEPPIYDSQRYDRVVYLVAPVPELNLCRLKIGFTTKIAARMKAYRTICPYALLLGIWRADPVDEQDVLTALRQDRVKGSELFDVRCPWSTYRALAALFE